MLILNHTSTNNKDTFSDLFIINVLALVITTLLVFGCTTLPSGQINMPEENPTVSIGDNAYFNFMRSEIESRDGDIAQATDYMKKAVADQPESIFLKKELVYLYLQNSDTEKALATIEDILTETPEDIGSLIIAGTIQKELGRDKEAASEFEKVLSLKPDQEKIYHILGEYYLENNAPGKAETVYQQMTERFPEKWEGFFFLGKIQAQQKKFAAAEKNFRHCLELEKTLVSPRFELIELYQQESAADIEVTVKSGDTLFSLCQTHYQRYSDELVKKISAANPEIEDISALKSGQKLILPGSTQSCDSACRQKVVDLYNSILNDYPENYRAVMELALFYYSVGEQQQADDLLIGLGRKSDKISQQIMQYISQIFISRQRVDDARTILVGLLRGAPENSDFHYLLGVIEDKQQKPAKAIQHFSKISADSTFYSTARLQMAFLYEETEQPQKAQAIFDQLLEVESDNAELLLYAGSFLERQEQYEQAEALYLRGIEVEPENMDLLFRLGVVYDKTGRKEAVIKQMKNIIKIAPDNANALNYLGYTYADMGIELDEAQSLIEKALRIEPDNGYITDSLGWVYYQKGEFEKAIELLTRALQLSPNDPILLEHLGDAYKKNGNLEKALETYRQSLEFAPEKDKEKIQNKINQILQSADIQ